MQQQSGRAQNVIQPWPADDQYGCIFLSTTARSRKRGNIICATQGENQCKPGRNPWQTRGGRNGRTGASRGEHAGRAQHGEGRGDPGRKGDRQPTRWRAALRGVRGSGLGARSGKTYASSRVLLSTQDRDSQLQHVEISQVTLSGTSPERACP